MTLPSSAKGSAPQQSSPQLSGRAVAFWLCLGVVAISTSPILVRYADMPALTLAFWRCLAGSAVLVPFAIRGLGWRGLERGDALRLVAAGLFLALHLGLWNASLALTTVAASTTLVSCAPLFVGLGSRFLGEAPGRRAWLGIVLATAGAVVIGLGDAAIGPVADGAVGGVRGGASGTTGGSAPLLGDVLAFAGAAAVAPYFLLGRVVRRRLPVTTYGASVYGVAAAVLLPACLLTGSGLGGYPAASWLALAGVVIGPQLLGHTVFNGLLATVSASVVSVAILIEPIGATVLAWLLFDELPGPGFWLGAPLVLAGVWLATTGARRM